MMKKGKIIAVALAVGITFMGAGYAYWTQDLTINSSVDTGDLEVHFEDPANVQEEDQDQPWAEAKVIDDGYGMTIEWIDVYPGVENRLEFNLANKGTLAAFVDDFKITSQTNTKTGDPFNITRAILCSSVKIDGQPSFIGDSTTTLKDALDHLNSLESNKGIGLEKDDSMDNPTDADTYLQDDVKKIEFKLQFDPKAKDNKLPQNGEFAFDITAKVYQFNDTTH